MFPLDILGELEIKVGISFVNSFDFALSFLISKGLYIHNSIQIAADLLILLLQIKSGKYSQSNAISDELIPYIAPLLPYLARNRQMEKLFLILGLHSRIQNDKLNLVYQPILKYFRLEKEENSRLFITFISYLVMKAEIETENIVLYGLLSELANSKVELFKLVYPILNEKMKTILNSTV